MKQNSYARNIRWVLAFIAALVVLVPGMQKAKAQQYTVVPGYYGTAGNTGMTYPDPVGYYYYNYNYPQYRYFYGLYM